MIHHLGWPRAVREENGAVWRELGARTLLVAPGLTTSNKKLLVASWHRY